MWVKDDRLAVNVRRIWALPWGRVGMNPEWVSFCSGAIVRECIVGSCLSFRREMAHSRMCVFCILTFCFYVAFRSKWVLFRSISWIRFRAGVVWLIFVSSGSLPDFNEWHGLGFLWCSKFFWICYIACNSSCFLGSFVGENYIFATFTEYKL